MWEIKQEQKSSCLILEEHTLNIYYVKIWGLVYHEKRIN